MLKKKFFKTKTEVEVSFEVAPDGAEQVELVCESNGWEPIRMKKNKQGQFKTKLRFPREQRFQFRYLVDEQNWLSDESADGERHNQFGGINSIVDTSQPS